MASFLNLRKRYPIPQKHDLDTALVKSGDKVPHQDLGFGEQNSLPQSAVHI